MVSQPMYAIVWLLLLVNISLSAIQIRNDTSENRPRRVDLRILPLGDSLTNGMGSSDYNGWRKDFVELAEKNGRVQMVGTRNGNGTMENNREEGWDGFTIQQITEKATNALLLKPNLILLMAGTNNMRDDEEAAEAPPLMEALIDKIIAGTTDAVLLVGSIIPSYLENGRRQARNDAYNAAVERMVSTRQEEGSRIASVDTSSVVSDSDLVDGLHPNDLGYANMAVAWMNAVNDAQDRGWLQAPTSGNGSVESPYPASTTAVASASAAKPAESGAEEMIRGAWTVLSLLLLWVHIGLVCI